MASRQKEKPSYTEEQATRWLAWLARGMQKHGQTVFLIEQLQPSWLPTRVQRCAYVLTSRFIGGLLFAITGLGIVYFFDRAAVLLFAAFGLVFASIFALFDALRFEWSLFWRGSSQAPARWQPAVTTLLVGLTVALVAEWSLGEGIGLTYTLVGLTWGPVWASRSAGRNLTNDIQTVETTRWSWSGARKGGRLIVVIEVPLLLTAMIVGDVWELQLGNAPFILFGSAPFVAILGVLIGGLKHSVLEMRTIPNQGIKLSIRTAFRSGRVGLLIFGLMFGLMLGLMGLTSTIPAIPIWPIIWVTVGVSISGFCGLSFGFFIALLEGGLDVIQHGILRLILSRKGYLPLHLVAFLDYAAEELRFLQKVGGGYMFIHRSLLEYFAALGEEEGENAGADSEEDRCAAPWSQS